MKKETASKNKFKWKNVILFSIILFSIVLAYVILRYNIIKGVPWQDFPLYILNKALALGAVVFISISFILGSFAKFWQNKFLKYIKLRKYFGLLGFGLASMHILISLLIFSPAYYPKFFTDAEKLNLTGELSLVFGIISFFLFLIETISSIPSINNSIKPEKWHTIQRLGYTAFFFVLLHVIVMGLEGWLNPSIWPGKLLPISLIAFIIILLTIILRIISTLYKPANEK